MSSRVLIICGALALSVGAVAFVLSRGDLDDSSTCREWLAASAGQRLDYVKTETRREGRSGQLLMEAVTDTCYDLEFFEAESGTKAPRLRIRRLVHTAEQRLSP